ncbi:MAG: PilZ domain-containing protein [Geobacteraceae bacterium]|nr:PilZ domain-containing protein [Geobacteraceae bacterium]
MTKSRRFSRVKCVEKCIVETAAGPCEVRLLDISLKGALLEHDANLPVAKGDRWKLLFRLDHSDIILEFGVEVVHCSENLAGVKFVEVDLDTMIHLRSLMEARTVNPEQVRYELEFLLDDE